MTTCALNQVMVQSTARQIAVGSLGTSGLDTTVFTFPSMAFSTERCDRLIVVGLVYFSANAGVTSTLTVAGVTATLVVAGATSAAGGTQRAELYQTLLSTGTTGTLVVTQTPAGSNRCAAVTYALYNGNGFATANGTSADSDSNPLTTSVTANDKAAIITVAGCNDNSTATTVIGGVTTEDFDSQIAGEASRITAASRQITSPGTQAISTQFTGGAPNAFISASAVWF